MLSSMTIKMAVSIQRRRMVFLREELHYGGSGSADRSKRFSRHDQHVSVAELWLRWKTSSVYNWTTADVINWLETHVELPQFKEVFLRQKIDGPSLPKLAMANGNYLTNVLHVRNPVFRQKILVKAIDAILFGAPRQGHNIIKDGILVALLCTSLGGCWFAYVQYKKSQANLANMTQELDALSRKEESLIMVTQKLVEAERRQELDLQEKTVLEERYRKEVEEARAETDRLACERQSKAEIIDQLQMTEKELENVKQLLAEAERKLRTGEGSIASLGETGGVLQMLLQMTYETEVAYHNIKRREAEMQLVQARENCEKVRRKRAAFMGSLRVAHSTTLDDVDRSITDAKTALEDVKHDLQERQFRWSQLELITGLSIMQNPGLAALRTAYQSAKESGALETRASSAARSSRQQRSLASSVVRATEDSASSASSSHSSNEPPQAFGDAHETTGSLGSEGVFETPSVSNERGESPVEGKSAPSSPPVSLSLEVAQSRPKFSVEDNSSQSSSGETPTSVHVQALSDLSSLRPPVLTQLSDPNLPTKYAVRSKSSSQLCSHEHAAGHRNPCGKSEENIVAAASAEENNLSTSSQSSTSINRTHSHHKGLFHRNHRFRDILRRKKTELA